ncbi:MAG TPA: aminotransferase class IV [Balneolaceae bacterium]|nr:aminotransferase class IV [Balneolaceae bacterium]
MSMKIYTCLNGEFRELNSAEVPVHQAGIYYGAGCFETILYTSGSLQYWEEHYSRLCKGLRWLGIEDEQLPDRINIHNNILSLLQANSLQDRRAKVRIQCSLLNEQGYSQHRQPEYFTWIVTEELSVREGPYTLKSVPTRVIPGESRPADLKLSNMLHFREAFRQAQRAGFKDALLFNSSRLVAETAIANIFWIREETIYTPSAACDILPGIMRKNVMEFLHSELNLTVKEGEFPPEALYEADAVWITNSLMPVKPVERIDNIHYNPDHSVLNRIVQNFTHL